MKLKKILFDWPNGLIWKITGKPTINSRKKKYKLFMDQLKPLKNSRILDAGISDFIGRGTNFLEIFYPFKNNISALCYGEENDFLNFKKHFPEIKLYFGDGRCMPFKENQFDIVFSNAVLEHVGDHQAQKRFVHEIIRVGKKCFITTPNYYFPLELHTLIPFVHYLPLRLRFWIYNKLGKSYWANLNNLNLLKPKEFYQLFPDSLNIKIINQKLFGITYNFIAICDKEK